MCGKLSSLFCLRKETLVGPLVTFGIMVVQYHLSYKNQNDALLGNIWPTIAISGFLSLMYLQSIGSGHLSLES